jgi:hypothetical protein
MKYTAKHRLYYMKRFKRFDWHFARKNIIGSFDDLFNTYEFHLFDLKLQLEIIKRELYRQIEPIIRIFK